MHRCYTRIQVTVILLSVLEPAQRHVGTIPGYFARTIESQPAAVSCVDETHTNSIAVGLMHDDFLNVAISPHVEPLLFVLGFLPDEVKMFHHNDVGPNRNGIPNDCRRDFLGQVLVDANSRLDDHSLADLCVRGPIAYSAGLFHSGSR